MSRPAWINVGGQDLEGTATVTAATDTLTIPGHGLSNGDIVMVEDLSGGADGPLIEGAVYFVRNVAGDDFQLSGTRGSQLKEFDTDGSADVLVAVPRYNAQALRLNDTVTLFHGSGDRLGAREGVRPGGSAVISVSGTNWTVHDHSGVVYPAITSTSGPYRYHQLEETDALDPADGSNDRIDALDLLIEDNDEDASGFRRSRVVYVTGTPGGGEPAVTANALRLGTILVPAGGTPSPSVSTLAAYTVASGGVLPVRTDSELPTSGLYEGMVVDHRGLGLQLRYDGTDWVPTSHVVQLDHQSLSGTVGTGTDLSVPSLLQGLFRSYTLEIAAAVSGFSNRPLVVRINGDDGANYRSNAQARDSSDDSIDADYASNNTAFPRTGYAGQFLPSLMVVEFRPDGLGNTGLVVWTGRGWANDGSTGSTLVSTGGRWNGSSAALATFRVRTSDAGDSWVSGSEATLWGHL